MTRHLVWYLTLAISLMATQSLAPCTKCSLGLGRHTVKDWCMERMKFLGGQVPDVLCSHLHTEGAQEQIPLVAGVVFLLERREYYWKS